jgi:hypothetical protein
MGEIDRLEKLYLENPGEAAARAGQIGDPTAFGVRGCAVIGTAYRLTDQREAAETVFKAGARLRAPDFDLAELCWRWAYLELERRAWDAGLELLDIALELHGPAGLPGPLDQGLPAILAVRAVLLYTRHIHEPGRAPLGLLSASADARRAVHLIPDPAAAPRVYLSAIQTLALVAMERAGGHVEAQVLLMQGRSQLRRMGIPRRSAPGARLDWALSVVSAELDGELDPAREGLLLGARDRLHQCGAHFDAARCGVDLALYYLQREEPPWQKLEVLALDAYLVFPGEDPAAVAALLLWRKAIHARTIPAAVVEFVAAHVRGIRRPDPALHATWEVELPKLPFARRRGRQAMARRINRIEKLYLEDPGEAVARAGQIRDPTAYGVHGCTVIGTAYRLADQREAAESVFKAGSMLRAPDFDLAELCWRWAYLELERRAWDAGLELLDMASELHGSAGLPGPLDRGLPAVLAVRAVLLYTRHIHEPGRDPLELLSASADARRAVDLMPDPAAAPRVYLSGIQTLALIAMERAGGHVEAQVLLMQARAHLRRMGIPRNSASGARLDWASAIVRAAIDGELDGVRETQLLGARDRLHQRGAHLDAARCGMDLALHYLEQDEPPWQKLEDLALDVELVRPGEDPAAEAALLLWGEAIRARTIPPKVVEFVAIHVRGLRCPDPALHATSDGWQRVDAHLVQRVKPWEIPKPRVIRRRVA